MKTQKEFILKTLLPYKQDLSKRATLPTGECRYITTDGRKCAIGRWMKEGEWQDFIGNVSTLFEEYKKEDIMQKEFVEQNLSIKCLTAMQMYHDSLSIGIGCNSSVEIMEKEIGEDLTELKIDLNQ